MCCMLEHADCRSKDPDAVAHAVSMLLGECLWVLLQQCGLHAAIPGACLLQLHGAPSCAQDVRLSSLPACCCVQGVTSKPRVSLSGQLETHAPLVTAICMNAAALCPAGLSHHGGAPQLNLQFCRFTKVYAFNTALHCSCRAWPTWRPRAALAVSASR